MEDLQKNLQKAYEDIFDLIVYCDDHRHEMDAEHEFTSLILRAYDGIVEIEGLLSHFSVTCRRWDGEVSTFEGEEYQKHVEITRP